MRTNVTLEGKEEIIVRLLVQHKAVAPKHGEHALASWRLAAGRRALKDILLEKGYVTPPVKYQVVRVFTKATTECPKCSTEFTIYFHHPDARYDCVNCKVELPQATPAAEPAPPRIVKPAPPPPPPKPPEPAPARPSLDVTLSPIPEFDSTLLDMGVPKKAAAPSPPARPAPPVPVPADATVMSLPEYDQTLLDLGTEKRTAAAPARQAPEPTSRPSPSHPSASAGKRMPSGAEAGPKSAEAPAPLPSFDATLMPVPEAEHTMLDMGTTPPPREPSSPQVSLTITPLPDAGQTLLDMGRGGRPAPLPPDEPAADVKTVVIGGSSGSRGTSRKTTLESTETAQPSTPSTTKGTKSHSKSDSIVGAVTGVAISSKALPPEVAQVAKDPKRLFGKYVLMKELGRGGAGVVYKAWDTLLLQYVALKFIRDQGSLESDTTSGTTQIEEFQREARMSVKLRHPNIVRIYELGCMSNRYYLSMEYIEGGTLLEQIHGGKERNTKTLFHREPAKFIQILQKVAEGVSYAHSLTPPVIHRDLKPHNVLVDKSGNPYVVDFGLAKEVELSEDGNTLTGVIKGTPTYMAPEQAEGRNRDVDMRSDVYSLGAILYEIITGRPPFQAESVPELLRKIATELPERPNNVVTALPPDQTGTSRKGKAIPKPLETICLKALEKNKSDRYQSAKDLGEDLGRYLKNEDILATEPGLWRRVRRKVRQHPVLSGVAATLLLTSIGAGIVIKATRPTGSVLEFRKLVEGIVERGTKALNDSDWVTLKGALEDLRVQAPKDEHVAKFAKVLKDHEELVARTRAEWRADLERIKRDPLKGILPDLRAKVHRCPELRNELRESLRAELSTLQARVIVDARRIYGTGARPAWVEELMKQSARDTLDQAVALVGLTADPELPYAADPAVDEARGGLAQVIAYQGTWTLQVNVAPFAEVVVMRADKKLAPEFTPLGLPELEVTGTSYTVEIGWPSLAEAKVRVTEEIKDIRHGQTVVIRGDISKSNLKLERK